MSVLAPVRCQSFAYTKTVSMPVRRKAHQTQLPAMPFLRMISVNRLAELVEVVAAHMEMPSIHQGIEFPDRKNSLEFFPACLDVTSPMTIRTTKNRTMMIQSI